jgi:hypothetical protein
MTQPTDASDSTVYWLLGGSALFFLGSLYAASRTAQAAAPYALAYGAPEVLPHYEAWRRAQTPQDRRAAVLRGVEHLGAWRRA